MELLIFLILITVIMYFITAIGMIYLFIRGLYLVFVAWSFLGLFYIAAALGVGICCVATSVVLRRLAEGETLEIGEIVVESWNLFWELYKQIYDTTKKFFESVFKE